MKARSLLCLPFFVIGCATESERPARDPKIIVLRETIYRDQGYDSAQARALDLVKEEDAAPKVSTRVIPADASRSKVMNDHAAGGVRQEPVAVEKTNSEVPAGGDDQGSAVQKALERLAAESRKSAGFAKLRSFEGVQVDAAATLLEASGRVAKRWWTSARGLLDSTQKKSPAGR